MKKTLIASCCATFIAWALLAATPAEAGVFDKLKSVLPFGSKEPYELPVNTVTFADKRTAKKVIVESVSAQRTDAESVRLNVRFYNKGRKPVRIAVRSSFFDQEKQLTETPGSWRTVHILPKSFAYYAVTSLPRNDVAGFLVEVHGEQKKGIF